jgi:hypothetical protein
VPEVLLSGNHAAISRWRRDAALRRTAAHRADLVAALRDLDRHDEQVLADAGYDRAAAREGGPEASGDGLAAAEPGPSCAGFPVSGEDMAH